MATHSTPSWTLAEKSQVCLINFLALGQGEVVLAHSADMREAL